MESNENNGEIDESAMAFHEAAGAAGMSMCSEIFGGVHPRSGKKSTSTTEMDGGISCGDRASALGDNGRGSKAATKRS